MAVHVILERVDSRRYRIGVTRDGRHDVGPDVPVRPGPGDAAVPHDLVHFVVEEQAGLRLGIYGQVAAGGECGGFFRPPVTAKRGTVELRRSSRLGAAGRTDVELSERLAAHCHTGRWQGDPHVAGIDPELARRIDDRLSEVVAQWASTPPGGRLVLAWPEELTLRHGQLPADRAAGSRSRPAGRVSRSRGR